MDEFITIFAACIGATLVAIIAANIYNSRSRKDRRIRDKMEVGREVGRITDEKMKEDKPLEDLERTHLNYKIDTLESKVEQNETNLTDYIKEQETKERQEDKEADEEKDSKSEHSS